MADSDWEMVSENAESVQSFSSWGSVRPSLSYAQVLQARLAPNNVADLPQPIMPPPAFFRAPRKAPQAEARENDSVNGPARESAGGASEAVALAGVERDGDVMHARLAQRGDHRFARAAGHTMRARVEPLSRADAGVFPESHVVSRCKPVAVSAVETELGCLGPGVSLSGKRGVATRAILEEVGGPGKVLGARDDGGVQRTLYELPVAGHVVPKQGGYEIFRPNDAPMPWHVFRVGKDGHPEFLFDSRDEAEHPAVAHPRLHFRHSVVGGEAATWARFDRPEENWEPKRSQPGKCWLEIDLGGNALVASLTTRAKRPPTVATTFPGKRGDLVFHVVPQHYRAECVPQYELRTRVDGASEWRVVGVFEGNTDYASVTHQSLLQHGDDERGVRARYLRFVPTTSVRTRYGLQVRVFGQVDGSRPRSGKGKKKKRGARLAASNTPEEPATVQYVVSQLPAERSMRQFQKRQPKLNKLPDDKLNKRRVQARKMAREDKFA